MNDDKIRKIAEKIVAEGGCYATLCITGRCPFYMDTYNCKSDGSVATAKRWLKDHPKEEDNMAEISERAIRDHCEKLLITDGCCDVGTPACPWVADCMGCTESYALSNAKKWLEDHPKSHISEDPQVVDPKSRYYDQGGIEVMDAIRAKLTPEQFKGFLLGNIIKYSLRANWKDQWDRDVEKIGHYQRLLKECDNESDS